MVSTVTKNPETLNERLDTIPLTDPFFAKLNSIIGDTTSSKRLMQNIIPTEGSKLKLRQNIPIWDNDDQNGFDLNEKVDYRQPDPTFRILNFKPPYNLENLSRFNVRLGLKDYRLSAEPMEQDDTDHQRSRWGDDLDNTVLNRSNHCELQFDINAAVEPVQFEQSVVMDFGDMDQDDFDDLNEMDQVAIARCKGLKRLPVMIEDMQPVNCATLEYSYRMLDQIDQFWAGPAHWKFRHSRRTNLSVGSRMSSMGSKQSLDPNAQPQKGVRKRKAPKVQQEVTIQDLRNVEEDMNGVILRITARMKGTQLTNQTIAKKWDTKKHKLPKDFKVPLDIFDKYENAATLHINSNLDVTFTGNDDDEDAMAYDYNNDNDRDYCSRVDVQSDTETETNTDMGQMDNQMEFDNPEMQPPPAPVDEIPDVFIGAPERIEKISIAFARRAKVVDMKQLKACSWNLLNNKHQADRVHDPKFSETLKDLPKVLSRPMAESMSMPLAFYAVLHLCNDRSLLLNQIGDQLSDFEVHFLNDNTP